MTLSILFPSDTLSVALDKGIEHPTHMPLAKRTFCIGEINLLNVAIIFYQIQFMFQMFDRSLAENNIFLNNGSNQLLANSRQRVTNM